MITEGQVRTTIAVLNAYIAEELRIDVALHIDHALLAELEQATDRVFDAQTADIFCDIEEAMPTIPSA